MEAPLLFPLPEIEPRIQQLLERTLAMNGLLVVTEARYGVSVESGAPPPTEPDPVESCLLYTSPSPRDRTRSRMPSSA